MSIIDEAADHLRAGRLVAFPTETVYGLGGDATNDLAVSRIYAAKGRPSFNPLIVHVPDLAAVELLVTVSPAARELAARFWPGSLTLVLPRRADCPVSLLASAGLDTLAVRVPAHPLTQALLLACGLPVAGPSANRSGRVSPTTAEHVREELGDRIAQILDGGPCRVGVESTVVDLSGERPLLLRPGGVTETALRDILDALDVASPMSDGEEARPGPGMLTHHYAPSLPVRLKALDRRPGEAFIAFGRPPHGIPADAQLSDGADPVEAAARLFATLRQLDRPGFTGIAIMPIPEAGLGVAINDRLRRAAAPRT